MVRRKNYVLMGLLLGLFGVYVGSYLVVRRMFERDVQTENAQLAGFLKETYFNPYYSIDYILYYFFFPIIKIDECLTNRAVYYDGE